MQKNTFRAGSCGPTGSDQMQGKGTLPSKVSVPLPGTNATQKPYKREGSAPKAPQGFKAGLIPGKI